MVNCNPVVGREQVEAPRTQLQVAQPEQPVEATPPADGLSCAGLGEGTNDRAARLRPEPIELELPRATDCRPHPNRLRRGGGGGPKDVPRLGPCASRRDVVQTKPAGLREDLVSPDSGHERAAFRGAQLRHVKVHVGRPENPVPLEDVPRERPDAVEFVIELDAHPLFDTEPADDELLPPTLVSLLVAANANGQRDG